LAHFHVLGKIFGNKEMRLLMLGLDAAGKTSEWFFDDGFADRR
jgi:hypothetical protein